MKMKSLLVLLLVVTSMAYAGEEAPLTLWPAPPLAKVLRNATAPDGGPRSVVIEGAGFRCRRP
ncbi:MAG: hypothetical protein R6V12_04325 [Candidatus Hydrogenedentota bacterium]